MAPYYCCVRGCFSNTRSDNISLLRFPNNPSRCSAWLRNCRRTDLYKVSCDKLHANYRICKLHFRNEMFAGLLQKRLKKSAIPTIFNFSIPDIDSSNTMDTVNKENLQPLGDEAGTSSVELISTLSATVKDVSVQTSPSLCAKSPRERKLKATIKRLRRKLALAAAKPVKQEPTTCSFLEFFKRSCSPELANF